LRKVQFLLFAKYYVSEECELILIGAVSSSCPSSSIWVSIWSFGHECK